jgi:hypothetical protein
MLWTTRATKMKTGLCALNYKQTSTKSRTSSRYLWMSLMIEWWSRKFVLIRGHRRSKWQYLSFPPNIYNPFMCPYPFFRFSFHLMWRRKQQAQREKMLKIKSNLRPTSSVGTSFESSAVVTKNGRATRTWFNTLILSATTSTNPVAIPALTTTFGWRHMVPSTATTYSICNRSAV